MGALGRRRRAEVRRGEAAARVGRRAVTGGCAAGGGRDGARPAKGGTGAAAGGRHGERPA
jgi:hypothetical protein